MTALIIGTVLAIGALTYVLWPLITVREGRSPTSYPPPERSGVAEPAKGTPDAPADDLAEAEIRRARMQQRVCPVCGPRPEPGARYCSRCGAVLA